MAIKDDGSNAQVKLQLKMNGPLSDLDLRSFARNRNTVFHHHREALVVQQRAKKCDFARMRWEDVAPQHYFGALKDMSAEIDLKVSLENQVGIVEINRPPNNHFDYKLISYIADSFDNFDKDIISYSPLLGNKLFISP